MNIYQRIVLIAGAIAVVFVLLTAPKFASVPNGNMKLKINKINANTRNFYYETDVPKLAIREFAVIAVTVLVFFALKKRERNVIKDSSNQAILVDEHSSRKFGDLSRFKKLFRWKYTVPIIVLLVLIAVPIILSVLRNYNFIHRPPTIEIVDLATASAAGGTEITITGTGFKATPRPIVTVGGNPATGVKVTDKTTLKATIPAGVVGPADIVVQNAKAKVRSLPFKDFSYYEDVSVISSTPDVTTAPPEGIEAPAKVGVTFNQDVYPYSVVIMVTGADGAEVAGVTAQDTIDTKMFAFTPTAPFTAGDYTATISGAKGMAAGNEMATYYTMSFRVRRTSSKIYKK